MSATAQIGISPGPDFQIGPFSGTSSHRPWNSDHLIRLPDGHRPDQQRRRASPAWLLTQGQRKPPALAARSTVDCWIAPIPATSSSRGWRPPLSDSSSATAGAEAVALVLAASAHVASTGRVELGGRAVGVALRAIRPLRDSHHQVTHAHAVTDAGLGVRLVTRCCSAP